MPAMPNRILKESICTSDSIDGLTWFEEVMFYRLIVNCDDYGRMDARLPILRARLFPLKTVTNQQVGDALESLRSAGMIDLYEVDGRSYLQMRTWSNHQQIRARKSKFPPPAIKTHELDINCNQVMTNAHVIQSESESESESEAEGTRAREDASATAAEPVCAAVSPEDDLTADIARNQQAQMLIRRYGLPDTEATFCAMLEDFATHGQQKVEEALNEAALADRKGGISVKFYRAVLGNLGKPRTAPERAGAGRDIMQRHTYTPEDYRSMVVDLDAEEG